MFDPKALRSQPYLRGLIRRVAARPRGRDALAFDAEDLQQELRLRLLQTVGRFDPERCSADAFASVVLARAARRHRRRCERLERNGRPLSLDEPVGEESPGLEAPLDDEARDLRIDLMEAIATLPADLVPLAGLLLVGTVAEVARAEGMPRSTLERRIERLKKHFEKAGLEIYS